MKLLNYILSCLIVIGIILYFLFPNEVVKTETEYIKGDTVTVITIRTIKDTVNKYVYVAKADTIILKDTVYVYYASSFNLGDSILGTSGRVSFNFEEFVFDSVSYRFPKEIKTITDTLKLTKAVKEPYYLDEWFYSSIALFFALLASLVGG